MPRLRTPQLAATGAPFTESHEPRRRKRRNVERMATAGIRKIALAAGSVAALAAAVAAMVLIAVVVNHPDQIVLAMDNDSLLDVFALILWRVASAVTHVLRAL